MGSGHVSAVKKTLFRFAGKLLANPRAALETGSALLRGTWYAVFLRLTRPNVRIQLPFLAYAPVRISGQGSVFIGRRCTVLLNTFEGLSITTLDPRASVHIAGRCNLGGTTIRCANRVEFGERVMAAACLIQDTMFVTASSSRLVSTAPEEIRIGANAWLTSQTIVLGGTHIGDGSVLTLSSVSYRSKVPPAHVAFGNLAYNTLSIVGLHTIRTR